MKITPLQSIQEFEALLAAHAAQGIPIALFKHSTRCSVSKMVLARMERYWEEAHPAVPVYYIDLLKYRELSDAVANRLEVRHESPQLLVVQGGKCVFHASHQAIHPAAIQW